MPYYLLCLSCLGFCLTVWDKHLARIHSWRIPEAVLLATALLGGAAGVLLAMLLRRHKTRKPLFCLCVPLCCVLQAAACWLSCR